MATIHNYKIERIYHLNDEEDTIRNEYYFGDEGYDAANRALKRHIANAERAGKTETISLYVNETQLVYTKTVNPEIVTLEEVLKR